MEGEGLRVVEGWKEDGKIIEIGWMGNEKRMKTLNDE